MSSPLTAVIVVEFPAGMTPEGAEHALKPARAAIAYGAGEIISEHLGPWNALEVASALPAAQLKTYRCYCGHEGDVVQVAYHAGECPEWQRVVADPERAARPEPVT